MPLTLTLDVEGPLRRLEYASSRFIRTSTTVRELTAGGPHNKATRRSLSTAVSIKKDAAQAVADAMAVLRALPGSPETGRAIRMAEFVLAEQALIDVQTRLTRAHGNAKPLSEPELADLTAALTDLAEAQVRLKTS